MNKKIIYIGLLLILIIAIICLVTIILNDTSNNYTQGDLQSAKNTSPSGIDRESDTIEVKEKMFIQQVNDIFYNYDLYKGKTIKIQGFIYTYTDESTGEKFYYVIRNTPGCCGNDGTAGFQIKWDNEYPSENEWVEAIGILKGDEVAYGVIPYIELTSLEVKQERGLDFVAQ